jgi:ssDNA-binding Zn-finger/Zn-ribbon topoisomerase 1
MLIGFAEHSCTCYNCGHIEYWNYYKPFERPNKCPKCGKHLLSMEERERFDKLREIAKRFVENKNERMERI